MISLYEIALQSKEIINKSFVIQAHSALRAGLHYDLRLGIKGMYRSWACRKLPDLVNGETNRIMIFRTPDHDSDWGTFQGDIQSGYGAGSVVIWDRGFFEPIKIAGNHIDVIFNGKNIKGEYHLLQYNHSKDQWLMFKAKENK